MVEDEYTCKFAVGAILRVMGRSGVKYYIVADVTKQHYDVIDVELELETQAFIPTFDQYAEQVAILTDVRIQALSNEDGSLDGKTLTDFLEKEYQSAST